MDYVKAFYGSVRALLAAYVVTHVNSASAQNADAETSLWERAQSADSEAAYQRYLQEYPVGRYASDAFRALVEQSIASGFGVQPQAGPDSWSLPSQGFVAVLY